VANKNTNQKRIKLLIFVGVLVYAGITFLNQQSLINSQLSKQSELLAKQTEIKQEITSNQNQLNYIGSDAYVIQEARERLGWMFGDETKYVEVPSGQAGGQQ
jgi:Septum formation initiator.